MKPSLILSQQLLPAIMQRVWYFIILRMQCTLVYSINISQGSVETPFRCGRNFNDHLLQIVCRVCQYFFENWLILDENIDKSLVPLWTHSVVEIRQH